MNAGKARMLVDSTTSQATQFEFQLNELYSRQLIRALHTARFFSDRKSIERTIISSGCDKSHYTFKMYRKTECFFVFKIELSLLSFISFYITFTYMDFHLLMTQHMNLCWVCEITNQDYLRVHRYFSNLWNNDDVQLDEYFHRWKRKSDLGRHG